MSATPHSRLTKATALLPLAVLSAAWTLNVAGLTGSSASATSATGPSRGVLPDGQPLPPAIGLDHPASVTGPGAQTISEQQSSELVDTATVSGIPAAALAAYQRAATVIDTADTSCHLPWQLIAAIGRVESNHGRADGNTLTSRGISTPGIYGPVLDGRHGTTRIADTDGGSIDGDTQYDRAVGPMQFIPSTWSIVSVDADGDGKRNPQDINDASLATAVYLCSGTENLATTPGQRAAVYRYNHSRSYVDTVLAIEKAYLAGDYTSVPNSTVVGTDSFVPVPTYTPVGPTKRHTSTGSSSTSTSTTPPPTSTTSPSSPGSTTSTPPKTTKPSTPSQPTSSDPGKSVTDPVKKTVTDTAASVAQLTQVCTSALTAKYDGLSGDALQKAVSKCVGQLTGKTLPQAQADVAGVVAGLADFVSGLLGGVLGGLGGVLGGN